MSVQVGAPLHPSVGRGHDRFVEEAIEDAQALILFCDGVEDAGHPELARRSRAVARDLLELAERVAAERSAREAMQRARDNAVSILERRAGEAAAAAVRDA